MDIRRRTDIRDGVLTRPDYHLENGGIVGRFVKETPGIPFNQTIQTSSGVQLTTSSVSQVSFGSSFPRVTATEA